MYLSVNESSDLKIKIECLSSVLLPTTLNAIRNLKALDFRAFLRPIFLILLRRVCPSVDYQK